MKAVVAAFNQEKALVGAFSVITNLRMQLFEALVVTLSGNTMKIDDKSGQVVCRNFVQTKLMFPLSSRVGIHVSSSYPDRAGCGGGGDQV